MKTNKVSIKTLQPYQLYGKVSKAKDIVKKRIINSCIFILLMCLITCIINEDFTIFIILAILLLISTPWMLYNPSLKSYYEPGKSYSWVKELAEGRRPKFLIKALKYSIVPAIILDVVFGFFPFCSITAMLLFMIAKLAEKKPEWFEEKIEKVQRQQHQDVDYNVKVDLNDIYGVNDKMTISYQNFHFNQKELHRGDYLLGVSPLGVYFASKLDTVQKTFIKYEDIDAIGLLATISNKFIFSLKSKNNVEIDIIVDRDDTLVVSPYKLFDAMLGCIDSYILSGGVEAPLASRRRKVVTSHVSLESSPVEMSENKSSVVGRVIDIDNEDGEEVISKERESVKRVIDIEFTNEVVAELSAGEMVTTNRVLEL